MKKTSGTLLLMAIFALAFSQTDAQTTVDFNYTGLIVNWTVPPGVTSITVEALGASGGNSTWSGPIEIGGLGSYMSGDFSVSPGQSIDILVGQAGQTSSVGGGGGGSFVVFSAGNVPLVVAGGGGCASSDQNGVPAVTGPNGTFDGTGGVPGGVGGNGGSVCGIDQNDGGGGGGFFTDGADANSGTPNIGGFGGKAYLNGGAGGVPGRLDGSCPNDAYGGYGGGGSTSCNTVGGGGGGGYSGGGGGQHFNNCVTVVGIPRAGGGGGGSFNSGTNQNNIAGNNSGDGMVSITYEITPIPTVSEWGLMAFILILSSFGLVAIGRRKETAIA